MAARCCCGRRCERLGSPRGSTRTFISSSGRVAASFHPRPRRPARQGAGLVHRNAFGCRCEGSDPGLRLDYIFSRSKHRQGVDRRPSPRQGPMPPARRVPLRHERTFALTVRTSDRAVVREHPDPVITQARARRRAVGRLGGGVLGLSGRVGESDFRAGPERAGTRDQAATQSGTRRPGPGVRSVLPRT